MRQFKFIEVYCKLDNKIYSIDELEKMSNDVYEKCKREQLFYCPNFVDPDILCNAKVSPHISERYHDNDKNAYKRRIGKITTFPSTQHKTNCEYTYEKQLGISSDSELTYQIPKDKRQTKFLELLELSKKNGLKIKNHPSISVEHKIINDVKTVAKLETHRNYKRKCFLNITDILADNFDNKPFMKGQECQALINIGKCSIQLIKDVNNGDFLLDKETGEKQKDPDGNEIRKNTFVFEVKLSNGKKFKLLIGWYWYFYVKNKWDCRYLLNKASHIGYLFIYGNIKRNNNGEIYFWVNEPNINCLFEKLK